MTDDLGDVVRRKRGYASYFHVRGDHRSTEIGVVHDWLRARYQNPSELFVRMEHRPNPLDPPDVVLVDRDGLRLGVEVTELVDGVAIHDRRKDPNAGYRAYSEKELRALVRDRIEEKCRAEWKDPTCKSRVLVIYSAEPDISDGEANEFIERLPPVPQEFFAEIWFMVLPPANVGSVVEEETFCRITEIKKA